MTPGAGRSITQLQNNIHINYENMVQTKHWIFVINNWTRDDEAVLEELGPKCQYLVYGYEVGAAGTHHIQGYAVFTKVKRLSEAKALISPRAHLEAKKGTPAQAAIYCKKDGLYKEYGSLPKTPNNGGVFKEFLDWATTVYDETGQAPSERDIAQEYPSLWVRYAKKLHELVLHHLPEPIMVDLEVPLRQWQKDLEDDLKEECVNDRIIEFYIDERGGAGKSYFQRYMLSKYPGRVQIVGVGKRDDIAHSIDPSKDIFLFNIPRKQFEYFNYAGLEMLKDRIVFSPKYDSETKYLSKTPHVVVFANEYPDMTKMSSDRYLIFDTFDYIGEV